MRKNILVILDSEPGYAVRFMEFVNRRRFSPFDVHAFTGEEPLRLYMAEHRVEVLLIAGKDYESSGKEWPAASVILLGDEKCPGGEPPSVSKYQSAVDVMRDVCEICGTKTTGQAASAGPAARLVKMPARVLGVFSPVGRCGKTTFSLSMGLVLSQGRPTLYLNLEGCSGLGLRLGARWESSLADLIFYIREGERDLGGRILPLVRNVEGLSLVPPVADAGELYQVRQEEWHALFAALRDTSAYEYVVADLGDVPLACPELLDECDLVYMPTAGDGAAEAKIREYEERLLLASDESDLLERIRKISFGELPPQETEQFGEERGEWLQSLSSGPVGQMAGELLRKEGLL